LKYIKEIILKKVITIIAVIIVAMIIPTLLLFSFGQKGIGMGSVKEWKCLVNAE
jgi:hypothetical protein